MKERICGTCKHNKYDTESDGSYACNNERSDNYAMWTEYDDTCDDWEEKGE